MTDQELPHILATNGGKVQNCSECGFRPQPTQFGMPDNFSYTENRRTHDNKHQNDHTGDPCMLDAEL